MKCKGKIQCPAMTEAIRQEFVEVNLMNTEQRLIVRVRGRKRTLLLLDYCPWCKGKLSE